MKSTPGHLRSTARLCFDGVMDLYDVASLADAARHIDDLLSQCDAGRRSRQFTAACIVGLLSLDESDEWSSQDEDYMMIVDNLAPDAELSTDDADAIWPQLTATAGRFIGRWT